MTAFQRLLLGSLVDSGHRPPSPWPWILLALAAVASVAWCILG